MPIPANGKFIHPDSVSKPKSFPAGPGKVVPAHTNVHMAPENLTVIPVDESKLKKIAVTDGGDHFILNSKGDTVKTGVPIPALGKHVPCIYPKSTPALPLRMKDNAINNTQYLSSDQGLIGEQIMCVMNDRSGNLWYGTMGNGVSRYDGKSFVHFGVNEGLSSDHVFSILEDQYGNLWFGTNGGGVTKYDGKSFVHFTENEGLSSNFVFSILEDQSGNLWFGAFGGGVTKYDGKSFVHFIENEGLSSNFVISILEDKSGNLWFGTNGGGVTKYDGKSFVYFTENEGLSSNVVKPLLEDQSGNIWFGTLGGGASMYDGKSFTHFTEKEGLSSNSIQSILEDQSGNLWFSDGGGISKFDGKSFVNYSDRTGLSYNIVNSLIEDESGNIWSVTGAGVSKINDNSFAHFSGRNGLSGPGLSGNTIRVILEDKSGNHWFGTYGGGITKYDGKSFTHIDQSDNLGGNAVRSIYEDHSGNIWIGTECDPAYGERVGLTRYDGKSFVHFTEEEGLSGDAISCILEDKFGNLWFGAQQNHPPFLSSITKYDGKSFVHFTEDDGLSGAFLTSIMEDKSGNLWFGTYGGGVLKYDGQSFTIFTEKEGLSGNVVGSITEDEFGNIWFGCMNGVTKYDGISFTHFTKKEGLIGTEVFSVLDTESRPEVSGQQNMSGIWISTGSGANFIEIDHTHSPEKKGQVSFQLNGDKNGLNAPKYKVYSFSRADGLKTINFLFASALLDSKNTLWWGGLDALERLDLNKFKTSEKTPVASLKVVDINETYLDYRNLSDSVKKYIQFDSVARFENYPLNLVLPYDQNHLTFYFSAIDWAAPHKLIYQYKLKGLDDNWSIPSDETKADYRNIPYGTFTFKVRAIGESQIWGKSFEYTFTITPPWWHTWWFRGLMIFVFVLALYLFYRSRTAALRARQKQLEKTVEERTADAVREKNEAQKQKIIAEEQKELVEEKHKEITDSINYAERIQRSFLATKSLLDENLKDYFVLFQPKDVVSGDFYWATKLQNNQFALVTADSTGHGVPGAIMSIANIACLKESVTKGFVEPNEILNETRKLVIDYLKNDGSTEGGKDGMDASLVCFDLENKKLNYAAANNPVWVVRQNEILEFAPDKMPVGKHDKQHVPFTSNQVDLKTGDVVYTLTDGMSDQFGGDKGKKFMYKKLKELLISIASDPMEMQKEKLNKAFFDWKGDLEQVDDVCVIGVRV